MRNDVWGERGKKQRLLIALCVISAVACTRDYRPPDFEPERACDVDADCVLVGQFECTESLRAGVSAGEGASGAAAPDICAHEGLGTASFTPRCVRNQCRAIPQPLSFAENRSCREDAECTLVPSGPCGTGRPAPWSRENAELQQLILRESAEATSASCAYRLGQATATLASWQAGDGSTAVPRGVGFAHEPVRAVCERTRCALRGLDEQSTEERSVVAQEEEVAAQRAAEARRLCDAQEQAFLPELLSATASYEQRVEAFRRRLRRTRRLWALSSVVEETSPAEARCIAFPYNPRQQKGVLPLPAEGGGATETQDSRDWEVHLQTIIWLKRVQRAGEIGRAPRRWLGRFAGSTEDAVYVTSETARPYCARGTYVMAFREDGAPCNCPWEAIHYDYYAEHLLGRAAQPIHECPPCPPVEGCVGLTSCLQGRVTERYPTLPRTGGTAAFFFSEASCLEALAENQRSEP